MDKIKSELMEITEKYKKDYSNAFDRNGKSDTLKNNVMLVSDLQLKLAEELVDTTKTYYKNHNIIDTSEIDEFKNNLYMDFIQFSTTFE
ncbi:hypothetical protein [Flavobacterium undicola]|uniref:hypothetical protein n=1 Tax=Flavobacterium undicola TaxID=1932779 RepID=UPI0013788F8E|nr:hypothetical protein [Flavobacterium undicola]MBA0883600.1 hypothetical protein [Flavobacterium undicola]